MGFFRPKDLKHCALEMIYTIHYEPKSQGIQSNHLVSRRFGVYNHLLNARYLGSMLPFSEGSKRNLIFVFCTKVHPGSSSKWMYKRLPINVLFEHGCIHSYPLIFGHF